MKAFYSRQIAWLLGRNKKDPMKEQADKNLKLAKMSGMLTCKSELY